MLRKIKLRVGWINEGWYIICTFDDVHNPVRQRCGVRFEFLDEHVNTYTHHVQRSANLVTNVTHLIKGWSRQC